jgi:hypothetical protein
MQQPSRLNWVASVNTAHSNQNALMLRFKINRILYIFVDPTSKLAMVQTAVRPKPISPEDAETVRLWLTLVKQLGGN